MFENRLVKLCFASNPYKLTKIYSVCRKHTFGRVRRDDLITKVNGYNWQFLPWYYFFSSQFLYRSLIQLYTDFPACCALFFRRLLKRDAFGTIKNIGSQTYINIYMYMYIYYIYAITISEASLRSANTTLCLLCQERTIEIC